MLSLHLALVDPRKVDLLIYQYEPFQKSLEETEIRSSGGLRYHRNAIDCLVILSLLVWWLFLDVEGPHIRSQGKHNIDV